MLVFLSLSPPPVLLFSPSPTPCSGEMMGLQEMSGGEATATEEEGLLSIEQELLSSLTGIIKDCQMSGISSANLQTPLSRRFWSQLFSYWTRHLRTISPPRPSFSYHSFQTRFSVWDSRALSASSPD